MPLQAWYLYLRRLMKILYVLMLSEGIILAISWDIALLTRFEAIAILQHKSLVEHLDLGIE